MTSEEDPLFVFDVMSLKFDTVQCNINLVFTVAILAQGTHWAVAGTQAFLIPSLLSATAGVISKQFLHMQQ